MADKYKLLKKIREGKKNVRATDLKRLMESFGFSCRRTKHKVIYSHPKISIRPSVVEHREKGQEKKIHECYVKNCLNAIDELMLVEGDTNEK